MDGAQEAQWTEQGHTKDVSPGRREEKEVKKGNSLENPASAGFSLCA
jgi:hypothetical protein